MALDDEARELDAVVARLAEHFPDARSDEIRKGVDAEFARFKEAEVRDFVPVLVESRVSDRLREKYHSHVPTAATDPEDPAVGSGPLGTA